ALPEQHVVGKREDDERAHLGEQREREAAGKYERRNNEYHPGPAPQHPATPIDGGVFHPSLVPISPLGRTMSSSTIRRYGSTGATCESLRPKIGKSSDTAKVCRQPINSEAMNAPASEPMPPTTTITKMIGPTDAAMPGSVTNALPPITPASPASAAP